MMYMKRVICLRMKVDEGIISYNNIIKNKM